MNARLDVVSIAAEEVGGQSQRRAQQAITISAPVEEQAVVRSRRLLLLERTMYRDGRTPFTSVFTVKLRGCVNELRLRNALDVVQSKHPLLRCVVEEAPEGPRFVERKWCAQIALRIVEREDESHWEREVRSEWVLPFRAAEEPLVRIIWLRGNEEHEWMLVAHHCICDGQSGITLLRDLLAAYVDPQRQSNTYNSLGGIDDLLPERTVRARRFRLRVGWRTTMLRLALLGKALQRAKVGSGVSVNQAYFIRWELAVPNADILLERCRKENVTIFSAIGVAVLQAFREVLGANALKHAYTMVNARRFLPRLHPHALFGIAPGITIPIPQQSPLERMPHAEFWECARTIRTNMAACIDRMGKRIYEYLAALESLHDRYSRLIDGTDAAPAVRHVTFSNVGRIDLPQSFGDIEVKHVYSPLVMVAPSPANTVVISSFGGAIEFAIISDEHSLPQDKASEIRDRAMELLQIAADVASHYGCSSDSHSSAKGVAAR